MAARRGISLPDLLVMLVVGALACVALTAGLDHVRSDARTTQCLSNLRVVLAAMQVYAAEHNGALPGSPWTSGAHLRPADQLADPPGPLTPFDFVTPLARTLRLDIPDAPRQTRYHGLARLPAFSCPQSPGLGYRTNLDFLLRSPHAAVYAPPAPEGLLFSSPDAQVPLDYSPNLRRIGNPAGKVFLMDGVYPQAVPPVFDDSSVGGTFAAPRPFARRLTPQGPENPLLGGSLGDPTLSIQDDDFTPLLRLARHGARSPGRPLSEYRLNVGFFDGRAETHATLDAMKLDWHSPAATTLRLTPETTYPRIIQQLLAGKSDPAYQVR
jgi:type II secretory pathway pseudopilin PulG